MHDEVAWLRHVGIDVELHEVSNDELIEEDRGARLRRVVDTAWSRPSQRRFVQELDRFRPDLVHLHNLFPLLSASVPAAALRRDIPVVWTLHNRRLVCVKGGHFRNDAPCHLCRPGWRLPGIWHSCYAESRGASALVTGATSLFGRMLRRRPITAVTPSRHMRDWVVETVGLDPDRVRVKPHGVRDPETSGGTKPDGATASRRFVFVGRLADYKGVRLLLDAWHRVATPDVELRIVGDGPLADEVSRLTEDDDRITCVGFVPPEEVPAELRAARAVVLPSLWEEPFGHVAVEAMACGRPVVTTGRGALSELVDTSCGWITEADPEDLAAAIETVATADDTVVQRATAARRRYEEHYSPVATTQGLLDIYEDVLRVGAIS